jgi:hypothetical protein
MVDRKASGSAVAKTQAEADAIARSIVADLMSGLGLSLPQALGIVGNLGYESKSPRSTVPFSAYQEAAFNRHGTKGAGWAQWTNARRTTFENWAKMNNLPPNSYAANIGYLKAELSGKIPGTDRRTLGALDKIRATTTPEESFDMFMREFERPFSGAYKGQHYQDRVNIMRSFAEPVIKEVQQSLASLGYDVTVDGVWGPQTAYALSGYQVANFPGELPGAKAISSLAPSMRESVRTMENRSMVDLLDYMDNRSIRQQELDSMRRMNIMNQEKQAFNQRLAENLGQYQPGRGGRQQNMARPDLSELTGTVGRMPMPGEGERLVRSPITGQQARLSELASMKALDAYRNEPRIVATPPFSGVGRMPMPGEGERLARSPIIGQMARASEIKSLSDLAGMNRQVAEQRAGFASRARASENVSMASLASMQGAEAARRADLASASRASENRSMADRASMDRKVAENRAVYAPFARAAENKSMRDLASFRNESALGQAAAARASENQSMRDLASMRAENLAVRTPPERAIGSLPPAAIAAVPSAGLAQGRRASENRSMQDLTMDRAGVFGPGPSAYSSSNPQTMNFRSMALSKVEDMVRAPQQRLAEAYGAAGQKSRAQDVIRSAIAADPRAAATMAGYVQGWGAKPGSVKTGASMPMDAVMAPRQLQAPTQPPAVTPPQAPAPIAYGTPQASRMASAYAGYAAARGAPLAAQQPAAPQRAAPAPQRTAPAPVMTQPRPQQQITNEPQFRGRTPGDRARSASFQPGGIFGYTSQMARGGGGYNPTPV